MEKERRDNIKNYRKDNSSSNDIFLNKEVDSCLYEPIKIIFETLFLKKKVIQQDLADYLSVNKSYVSRVVNGLQIPPLRVRIKIAEFFNTDSSLIWRVEDLPYIRKIIKEQAKPTTIFEEAIEMKRRAEENE